jgi:hypothetical protein
LRLLTMPCNPCACAPSPPCASLYHQMYTIYYWYKSTKFWGRTLPIVLALDTAGAEYEIKEPTDGMPVGG